MSFLQDPRGSSFFPIPAPRFPWLVTAWVQPWLLSLYSFSLDHLSAFYQDMSWGSIWSNRKVIVICILCLGTLFSIKVTFWCSEWIMFNPLLFFKGTISLKSIKTTKQSSIPLLISNIIILVVQSSFVSRNYFINVGNSLSTKLENF